MKGLSLALMLVAICSRSLAVAAGCIVAGGILGWRAGLFEPLA